MRARTGIRTSLKLLIVALAALPFGDCLGGIFGASAHAAEPPQAVAID